MTKLSSIFIIKHYLLVIVFSVNFSLIIWHFKMTKGIYLRKVMIIFNLHIHRESKIRHETPVHNFAKYWNRKFATKRSLYNFLIHILPHLNGNINIWKHSVPHMLGHCFLKHKLARDMTHGRQQLLWQKQVTVICSIDLDSQIDALA